MYINFYTHNLYGAKKFLNNSKFSYTLMILIDASVLDYKEPTNI